MAGSTALFEDKFNLPVEAFIVQALQERFPDLDIRQGTALYQTVVLPLAFGFQPFRDRLNILRKNQSLRFFQYMIPEELNRLTSNFLVQRAASLNANGTVRVFFSQPGNYTVPTSAVFSTDDNRTFSPVQSVTINQSQIILNFQDGQYYVDVPAQAALPGADGAIDSGLITKVEGVSNAVGATNPAAFFGGRDEESNANLVDRTRRSIATRTITSKFSTEALLREQFGSSLISMEMIGFGDDEMLRDTAKSFVGYDDLFTTTYCRKVNVSVDADGTVFEGPGAPPATNRFVGAIIDTRNTYSEPDAALINNPYYFFALRVVRNGELVKLALARGDAVEVSKVDQSAGPDPDDGSYRVTDIVYQAPYPGHVSGDVNGTAQTMLLILDRPFVNPQPNSLIVTPGSANLVAYQYKVQTGVGTDLFHIGGYADLYVHTVNTFSDEIVIAELFPSAASLDFFDVPISATPITNPMSNPWYEDGKVFQLPVISFVRVEQIDLTDSTLVLQTLEQGKDFIYVSSDPSTRLTADEVGTIRFIGAAFSGARMRVTYTTNPDIRAIQDFVGASIQRDVTKNILTKAAKAVVTDVEFTYNGTADAATVQDIVQGYVNSRPLGGEITVNQIVSILSVYEVTDITMPMTLRIKRFNDDGSVTTEESTDRIQVQRLERFVAAESLSIG